MLETIKHTQISSDKIQFLTEAGFKAMLLKTIFGLLYSSAVQLNFIAGNQKLLIYFAGYCLTFTDLL